MSSNATTTADSLEGDHQGAVVYADHEKMEHSELAIGVIIGRSSEYFNFLVFGIASALAFPTVFFPFASPALGMVYSFIIFALAFIARPFGSQLFSVLHHRYGRGTKLAISLFALGTATCGIAFLPGYASIGNYAILLLVLFRLCQGLAVGGSWDGLPSLLAMNAPQNHRGWYAMIPQLSGPIGFIIAAALFAWLMSAMSHQQFIEWGWRYPFFVSLAINVVAVFSRMIFVTTPQFARELDRRKMRPVPLSVLLRNHWRTLLLGSFAPLASYALFHLVTIFILCWAILFTNQPIVDFLIVQVIGGLLAIVAMMFSGILADRIGRRKVLGILAVLIAIFSGWVALLLGGTIAGAYLFILIGFVLLGFSHAQSAGSMTSEFPEEYRFSGALFSSDLSWFFGAAFAPLVALLLAIYLGVPYVGLYLLSGAIVTLIVLRINYLADRKES